MIPGTSYLAKGTAMTFEEFRGSGADCSDIGAAISDEIVMGSAGRLYGGTLYIERWTDDRHGVAPPGGPTWLLTLYGDQWNSHDLEALEQRLYDWGIAEGALAETDR